MSDRENNYLVFFIPGIMGSSLYLREKTYNNTLESIRIWGPDLLETVNTLIKNFWQLNSPNIFPGEVISELTCSLYPRPIPVYKPIIDFCTSAHGLGLNEKMNFFPFPYDWRKSNIKTAEMLFNQISILDPNEEHRIRLIAHSMGGIIARIMLNKFPKIRERTDLLFQIASPIKGSAIAYHTLRKRPKFQNKMQRVFDRLWRCYDHVDPKLLADFILTLQGFESLYQLIFHPDIKFLFSKYHATCNPLDRTLPEIWPPQNREFVEYANQVHDILSRPLGCNVRSVYCDSKLTDISYYINKRYDIIGTRSTGKGDGAVSCTSAVAYLDIADQHLVSGPKIDHSSICSISNVFALLKEHFE